jgi:hypothetical protein
VTGNIMLVADPLLGNVNAFRPSKYSDKYCKPSCSFVVAARQLARNRPLIGGAAYADDSGHVVVDARNMGQQQGYVVECHLVRRRLLPWRRFRIRAASRELPIHDAKEPVAVSAFGTKRFTFDVQLSANERQRYRILLRVAPEKDVVLKIVKWDGIFPDAVWQPPIH